MVSALGRLYARRIVNVNVNILLANVLAMMLTALAVHFSRYIGIDDHEEWLISVFTFTVDIVFDVSIYYGLHWLANHWPRRLWHVPKEVLDESPKPSFFKDATSVQFQRMCLSPLFYLIAVGIQQAGLHADVDRVLATVAAFTAAIVTTRALHTLWMLRSERAASRTRADRNRVRVPTGV